MFKRIYTPCDVGHPPAQHFLSMSQVVRVHGSQYVDIIIHFVLLNELNLSLLKRPYPKYLL